MRWGTGMKGIYRDFSRESAIKSKSMTIN